MRFIASKQKNEKKNKLEKLKDYVFIREAYEKKEETFPQLLSSFDIDNGWRISVVRECWEEDYKILFQANISLFIMKMEVFARQNQIYFREAKEKKRNRLKLWHAGSFKKALFLLLRSLRV